MTTSRRTVGRAGFALVVVLLSAAWQQPSSADTQLVVDSVGGSRQVRVHLQQPCLLLNGAGDTLVLSGPGATHPAAISIATPAGEPLHTVMSPGDASHPLDLPAGCRTSVRPAGTYLLTIVSSGALSVRLPLLSASGRARATAASPARLESQFLTGTPAATATREDLPISRPGTGTAVLASYEHFAAHVVSRPEVCVHPAANTGPCPAGQTVTLVFAGPLTTIFAGSSIRTTANDTVASFEDVSVGARTSKLDLLLTLPDR